VVDRAANLNLDRLWQLLGINNPESVSIPSVSPMQFSLGDLSDHLPPMVGVRAVASQLVFVLGGFGWIQMLSNAPGGTVLTKFWQTQAPTAPGNGSNNATIHPARFTTGVATSVAINPVTTGRGTPGNTVFVETGGTNPATSANTVSIPFAVGSFPLEWYVPRGGAITLGRPAAYAAIHGIEWIEFQAIPQETPL